MRKLAPARWLDVCSARQADTGERVPRGHMPGEHAPNHISGNHMPMNGKEFFSKSSPILFGVRVARERDLVEEVRRAHEACADFVGMNYAGTARHERLEVVLSALTTLDGPHGKMGLCLFADKDFMDDVFGERTRGLDLSVLVERHAHKRPLLVASPNKPLLAALEPRFPNLATAHVLSETCACGSMKDGSTKEEGGAEAPGTGKVNDTGRGTVDAGPIGEAPARCILSRALASGCRLCGLRTMGVYALVAGRFSRQDFVRMSLDGADAFLLDEAADLEAVAMPVRRMH